MSTVDLIDYDEFVETRFYKEWAQPQRLVDFTSAVLERSATSAAMFGVFRHERDGLRRRGDEAGACGSSFPISAARC